MKNKKEIAIIVQLKKEIHQAILSQEKEKAESLKYLLSLLEKESFRQDSFSQEKALQVLNREMKKKKEALVLFEKGSREDLAKKEKQDIVWLEKLLPLALEEQG
ncbi:MAG: GatB/YqeY domain-containing protein [Candidatus Shapirobacteria bacterium]